MAMQVENPMPGFTQTYAWLHGDLHLAARRPTPGFMERWQSKHSVLFKILNEISFKVCGQGVGET